MTPEKREELAKKLFEAMQAAAHRRDPYMFLFTWEGLDEQLPGSHAIFQAGVDAVLA